ncbi:gluconokinase [Haloferula chungangensis]|uniref:Gluconokinase n=1 Tax=Haloferula chungangensis TaxID=1048331 RepID=A0ABW2L9N2_9BACT
MPYASTNCKKIVIAGVSGSGKTTIGLELAHLLDAEFVDADDFHSPEAIAKMAAGQPLEDEDRVEWLSALGRSLAARDRSTVLACSALKKSYRDRLRELCDGLTFVLLTAETERLRERIEERARGGHFMPSSLLDSQLETLEQGDDMIVIVNVGPPEEVAARVLSGI